jgi:AcrR family transcriptional regulator
LSRSTEVAAGRAGLTRARAGGPAQRKAGGLRERKKARTRATIRQEAMRLFREQGYEETTVEQIAEAAEVSPSTFFRYYPTKEDVVLQDEYDELIVEAFRAQPPELSPLQAMRKALREVIGSLTATEREEEDERLRLSREVPELRAARLDEMIRTMRLLAAIVAERVGRSPEDPAVMAFAGALIGVGMSAMLCAGPNPVAKTYEQFDDALAFLEAGLPL